MTAADKPVLLRVEDVSKHFGGLVAVDHLSFEVREGEIFGIIGPNGAGKSTILGVISGFYPATGGKVFFKDKDITKLKTHEIVALGIGRQFQTSTLFMSLSVSDNVFYGFHLDYKAAVWKRLLRWPSARKEEKEFRRRGDEILDRMGLGAVKNEITKNLPHGYQRILGICIALASKPTLLLLDEPMTGMNETEIDTMLQLGEGHPRQRRHHRHDRAQHDGGHEPVRPHRGGGPRPEDRGRPAQGDPGQRAGDRSLSGERRDVAR